MQPALWSTFDDAIYELIRYIHRFSNNCLSKYLNLTVIGCLGGQPTNPQCDLDFEGRDYSATSKITTVYLSTMNSQWTGVIFRKWKLPIHMTEAQRKWVRKVAYEEGKVEHEGTNTESWRDVRVMGKLWSLTGEWAWLHYRGRPWKDPRRPSDWLFCAHLHNVPVLAGWKDASLDGEEVEAADFCQGRFVCFSVWDVEIVVCRDQRPQGDRVRLTHVDRERCQSRALQSNAIRALLPPTPSAEHTGFFP